MTDKEGFGKLSQYILTDGFPFMMDIEKSQGSYIKTQQGDTYLDMFSMFASGSVGYNHPYLKKHQNFLGKMAINKPTLSDVYNQYYVDFLHTFSRVAVPDYLQYMFFIEGGALAVENALKAAFDWRTKWNFLNGIKKEAGKVIHFKESFHGRSGYTLSLTNTADPRKYQYFPKFDWPRIENPKLRFPLSANIIEQTVEKEQEAVRQIQEALETYKHQIACIIIEPIQAEGGDNYFRNEFMIQLRDICDQHDILLIFDEVQTGMGITGKMWAHQHFSVKPDIMAFGKKTQVCGILANKEKLDKVSNNVFTESSRINSTFGGNFIDMIRLKLILEIYEKEQLLENAQQMGDYLLKQLQELADKHQRIMSNVRGLGLFCAFDLPTSTQRDAFLSQALDQKLILLKCGKQSIRLRPHLNIKTDFIDEVVDRLDFVMTKINL